MIIFKWFVNGFLMCLILGVFLYLAILLFKPLLFMLDQPTNVVDLAIPYLEIVAASLVPLLMFQALKQYSDGLSLTANSMYATVLANIVTHGFGINLGYGKNYKNDDSKNIIPFGIFMFGEELHNNHHNYPNKVNFAIRKFEIDLGYLMMVLLEKVNLLKIKRT